MAKLGAIHQLLDLIPRDPTYGCTDTLSPPQIALENGSTIGIMRFEYLNVVRARLLK